MGIETNTYHFCIDEAIVETLYIYAESENGTYLINIVATILLNICRNVQTKKKNNGPSHDGPLFSYRRLI